MATPSKSIEALLTLDATGFHSELSNVQNSVKAFVTQVNNVESGTKGFSTTIKGLLDSLNDITPAMERFNRVTKEVESFNKFANGVKALATAVQLLGTDSNDASVGLARVTEIIKSLDNVLSPTEVKITGVATALRSLGSKNVGLENLRNSVQQTKDSLLQLGQGIPALNRIDTTSNKVKQSVAMMDAEFKKAKADLLALGQGVTAFNNIDSRSNRVKSQVAIMNAEFEKSKAFLEQMAWTGVEAFNKIEASSNKLNSAQQKVIASDERIKNLKQQVAQSSNQVAVAEEKQSVATDKATNSMRRQETASKGLGRAMSSLRMMGSMVGSMIAYNFAHNLAMATTETINAKSEMNGYFQMLGYTTRQTKDFNDALEKTVQKFPRLNKYALGETISSIGVEFELTTKEMKKAMPVVSMITSEYLRAGRNVNEASLAVKDILQGEFQRLSRETGVKGDQLKEAGWSGDKSDVMGLLNALEKVGKERNWDTFVMKANSLNDAVLILQNRFSEWSADMVERVQPAIVGVFNDIMSIAEPFGKVINGVADWLGGEGLGQSIVQWGGLATAISGVAFALVHARTGAGLMQIAQMGLTKTIGATILGIDAESLAETKLRDRIVATITGLKAEEVATIGKTKAIAGSLLGLDMAILKEEGFRIALLKSTTQMDVAKLKAMGLGKQIGLLGLSFGLPLAIVGAFAVGVGILAVRTMEATKKMEKFYNLVNKGKDIVKEAKDSVKSLKDRQEDLKKTQDKYVKGSQEYLNVGKAIKQLDTDIADAKQKVKDSQEAVNIAQKSQENFDDGKLRSQLELERQINSALIDVGISSEDARVLSSDYLREANDGAEQLNQTLQNIAYQNKNIANAVAIDSKKLQQAGFTPEEIEVRIKPLIEAGDWIKSGKEKRENATSLTDVVMGWLEEQYGQITWALQEFTINWDTTGWVSAFQGLIQGFARGMARLPIFHDFWSFVFEKSNIQKQYGGKGWAGLEQWAKDSLYQVGNVIFQSFNEPFEAFIKKPILDAWNSLISFDWLPKIDIWGTLMSWIFPDPVSASSGGSDHPSFMQDISNILGFDIQSWITNFNTDPLGTLGIQLPSIDIIGLITSLIPIGGEGGFDVGAWLGSIFNIDSIVASFTSNLNIIFTTASTIASNVSGVFSNLKSMIWGHIQGILSNVTSTFTNIKNTAVNQINGLSSGIKGGIDRVVGAFNYMKDAILNSAKAIYDGVKSKFDSVKNTIGDFWNKLTNPSSWGSAGSESYQTRSPKPQTARRMFAGSPVVRSAVHHGAGVNPYQNDSQSVKLKDLMSMIDGDNKVKLSDFLAMFSEGGFGTWDFHEPVKKRVFDTAKGYKTGSPSIKGIGTVGDGYKVGKFWNGKPSFSFDEFQAVAQAIFSAIPYKFYYDSEWKGNWVNALLSGAVNCSDGADALIALANVFGFSGYKQHTKLKSGVGHFFAVIGGKPMDTTNFQNHGSWSPLGGAGIPTRTASYTGRTGETQGKTVNVTVDMSNSTIYGVDDLDERIAEGVDKGMQKHMNDPFTIAI